MASDTPAPPAEPSDEALIERVYDVEFADQREQLQTALRARLASNAEALAEAQGRIHDLTVALDQQDGALAGYREQAEAAEGRIAELEAKEESALRVADKNLSRAIHAEAALAECRAVGWFTTTNNGALLFQQSDDDPREVHDNGRPVYRALAKEAPRHE